ncbi:MAG: rod shape-determining protein [bacterium]|nr:rod shape-determining protein [bacterium]
MFSRFWNAFSYDIGIDLGTANTVVFVKGKGIVIKEPSIVAQHKKTKQIIAIGTQAKKMLGKTPGTIEAIRPLRNGVISDFDITLAMLKELFKRVHELSSGSVIPRIPRPRVLIGIPAGVTEVERRAVQDAALQSGARVAYLIEEPMAAAIGANLPIEEPTGSCIVDIGGGTTEMAIISLGGLVINTSLRVAGNDFDQHIINYIKNKYNIIIGEKTAEDVKISIGTVSGEHLSQEYIVRGRDLITGLPKAVVITSSDIKNALSEPINIIIHAVSDMLENAPPELVSDVLEKGICLAGGGSLINGLPELLSERVKITVYTADDPLTCVVRGCAKVLEDIHLLEKVRIVGGLRS